LLNLEQPKLADQKEGLYWPSKKKKKIKAGVELGWFVSYRKKKKKKSRKKKVFNSISFFFFLFFLFSSSFSSSFFHQSINFKSIYS